LVGVLVKITYSPIAVIAGMFRLIDAHDNIWMMSLIS
jgi:hypothetical protein